MHFPARFLCRWLAVLLLPALAASRLAAQDSPPVIVSNPQTQTVNAGQNVTLTVGANGSAPLSFQWWFTSLQVPGATNNIPGATNSSLVLNQVNALVSGSYVAVVTNAFGSATSAPAVLTVVGPPVIQQQPTHVTAYVGQSATFSVIAFSRTTMTYQWLFQGNTLTAATNRTLTVTNLTTNNSGFYSVQVKNNNGTTTSFPAGLIVLPLPMPALQYGFMSVLDAVRVPVVFTAYGIETNVSFSSVWDPAHYSLVAFEADLGALPSATEVTLNESLVPEGRLGVSLVWSPGVYLPPGTNTVGDLVFAPLQGVASLYAGRISFTNNPVASVVAPPVQGQTNIILNGINPQVIFRSHPTLNRQTGYLEQTIFFVNPGRTFAQNARLTVSGMGLDSKTNAIALANAQGYLLPNFLPYVDFGAIAASEIREGRLQYYVTDRTSRPLPTFSMYATPAVSFQPPSGNVLTATVRRTNDMVLVEFPTVPLFRYYIQYSSNPTNFNADVVETSLPHVLGTGSNRQWLDSGPPRTAPSMDHVEQRYYRVLEVE